MISEALTSPETVPGVTECAFHRCVQGKLVRVRGTRHLGNRCVPADFGASGTLLGALARTLVIMYSRNDISWDYCENKTLRIKDSLQYLHVNVMKHYFFIIISLQIFTDSEIFHMVTLNDLTNMQRHYVLVWEELYKTSKFFSSLILHSLINLTFQMCVKVSPESWGVVTVGTLVRFATRVNGSHVRNMTHYYIACCFSPLGCVLRFPLNAEA